VDVPAPNSEPVRTDAARRTAEFVRLLTQHERRVYGYILSLVPRWADVDEILQETNVRLWEQFDSYQPQADFGAWACTIAHYQVLTFRKRTERERSHFSQQFVELVAAESTALADEADVRFSALEECLGKLPASQRQLLRQCYGGKSTLKEVAATLGRSVAATYKLVSRIRHLLHQCIQRRLEAEREA
jgi:RNA polymerase sigma-70 factor (ECF subfamily)